MPEKQLPVILLICISFLTVTLYWAGLHGPLLLDDFPQLSPLLDAGDVGFFDLYQRYMISESGPLGRPVSMFTFIVNASISGSDIWLWKLTNLIIHVFNGLLAYLVFFTLVRYSNQALSRVHAMWIALIPASIWLIHPINVSTVLYTVQRMAQLSALFCLSGILAFSWARIRMIQGFSGWVPGMLFAFLVCFPLAIFSKENAFLFPGYLLILEIFIFRMRGFYLGNYWDAIDGYVLLILFACFFYIFGSSELYKSALAGYEIRDYDLWQRLLTQFRVLIQYLNQIFLPSLDAFGFYHDDIDVSISLLHPPTTLVSILLIVGLLSVAWVMRRKAPLISAGIFFFFFGHSLESSVFALEMMYEHRNYLPLVGICLMIAGLVLRCSRNFKAWGIAGGCMVLALSWQTHARVEIWSSAQNFYRHAYATHPDSKRVNLVFMQAYLAAGQFASARSIAERFQDQGFHLVRLFLTCKERGQIVSAQQREGLRLPGGVLESYGTTALIEMANQGLSGECSFPALWYAELIDRVLEQPAKDKDAAKLLMYQAHFFHKASDFSAAIRSLEQSYARNKRSPMPLFLASEWSLDQGQVDVARGFFERAKRVARARPGLYAELIAEISRRFADADSPLDPDGA